MLGQDRDRSTAVLSIRHRYADRILAGTKTVEFRRQPLPEPIERVLIWRTGNGGGITGQFTIVRPQLACTVSAALSPEAGIDYADLLRYAGSWDRPLWAIRITAVIRFPRVLTGPELGIERAPQSWRYAPTGWRQALTAATAAQPGTDLPREGRT
jgi:predicted transcriptional regulator